jgi:hypothetical protein
MNTELLSSELPGRRLITIAAFGRRFGIAAAQRLGKFARLPHFPAINKRRKTGLQSVFLCFARVCTRQGFFIPTNVDQLMPKASHTKL